MSSYLDNLINVELEYINQDFTEIKDHAKLIYIELLKLEYPAATDTHRESLAKQAFLYAIQFHKAIQNF
jgi:hypothetical protein